MLRPFAAAATFDVAADESSTYTLRVRCSSDPSCQSDAAIPLDVIEDGEPGDLGNSLRAVRATSDVELAREGSAYAVTFNLYRGSGLEGS